MNLEIDCTVDLSNVITNADPALFVTMNSPNADGFSANEITLTQPINLFQAVDLALDYCTFQGQFTDAEDMADFERVAEYMQCVAQYAYTKLNTTPIRN